MGEGLLVRKTAKLGEEVFPFAITGGDEVYTYYDTEYVYNTLLTNQRYSYSTGELEASTSYTVTNKLTIRADKKLNFVASDRYIKIIYVWQNSTFLGVYTHESSTYGGTVLGTFETTPFTFPNNATDFALGFVTGTDTAFGPYSVSSRFSFRAPNPSQNPLYFYKLTSDVSENTKRYRVHKFKSIGNHTLNVETGNKNNVDFLVIGGGESFTNLGGRAAGGYRCSVTGEFSGSNSSPEPKLTLVEGTTYPIQVGHTEFNDGWSYFGNPNNVDSIVSFQGGGAQPCGSGSGGGATIPYILTGTATGGNVTSLTNSTAPFPNLLYVSPRRYKIKITAGTGAGQTRLILTNTTTIVEVIEPFNVAPDNTSVYEIFREGQGFNGGSNASNVEGGGGGAGGVGGNGTGNVASGEGGQGLISRITGVATPRAGACGRSRFGYGIRQGNDIYGANNSGFARENTGSGARSSGGSGLVVIRYEVE